MKSFFDKKSFQQALSTDWVGRKCCFFDELDSTNSYVKNLPSQEIMHGMLCLADYQTNGRGQYERDWESDAGQNLTFSLAFQPHQQSGFHVLTLAFCCAIVEQLNTLLEEEARASIKWPNDIMLADKKIAGLLTETMFSGNTLDRLVIGIGLNLNQDKFAKELRKKATSVYQQTRQKVDREVFLSGLLNRIEQNYLSWDDQQDSLLRAINRNIRGYGKWVNIKIDGHQLEDAYKLLGINEWGKLLMLNRDGGIESFSYEQIRLIID